MQGNIQKIFIVTEITASELVSLNCLYSSSETRLFRHLSDYVFGVRNFENTNSMRVIFFFRRFKL